MVDQESSLEGARVVQLALIAVDTCPSSYEACALPSSASYDWPAQVCWRTHNRRVEKPDTIASNPHASRCTVLSFC